MCLMSGSSVFQVIFPLLLQNVWFWTGYVLGYPRNSATLLQFPRGPGRHGDPVSAGEERYFCRSGRQSQTGVVDQRCWIKSFTFIPLIIEIQTFAYTWLRCGDSGEDPDQSQQRSETNDRQDFWRNYTKGKETNDLNWTELLTRRQRL